MRKDIRSYDVAVIGAGPVGCVTALAYAARGAEVLMIEANPKACGRLAGEWLHPGGLEILQSLGVELSSSKPYATGKGFVVFPDDGTSPIVLPYQAGSFGIALHHERLVDRLREHAQRQSRIDYHEPAKATRIVGQNLTFTSKSGASKTIFAEQIVGAAGRSGVAHAALGIGGNVGTYSRMAGILLENTDLPFEGYGHVVLGGLGPVLIYRISADLVRVCIDVPLSLRMTRDKEAVLYESYAYALPKVLREPFRRALLGGEISFATNQTRSRCQFGRPGLALVGDAVGHHHPLTALGMTLGFQDGVALAESTSFSAYRRERSVKSRVPEMLAVALYEIFADTHDEVIELRRAIYDLWRRSPAERFRTMRFLACQEHSPLAFGGSFAKAMSRAAGRLIQQGVSTSQWGHVATITEEIGSRVRWFVTGALHLTEARPARELPRGADAKDKEKEPRGGADDHYAGALRASAVKAPVVELPSVRDHATRTGRDRWDPTRALERGAKTLRAQQDVDGSWEGEVVWCPMLAAQFVLAWHMMGHSLDDRRKQRVLLHFARTRLHDGTWGLSEVSEPNLFVTTLVYVASRLLGQSAEAPSLDPARRFIEREGGATSMPSWGKFWLAMLSLYSWDGVNPVIPELWALPTGLPIHPSRFQSHTRVTYSAMAAIYGDRFQTNLSPVLEELRAELYPQGYDAVDFPAARHQVRREDLYEMPGAVLKVGYDIVRLVDRMQTERGRQKALVAIRDDIRWELRTSNHSSISALSCLLSTLALYAADPADEDVSRAVSQFERWLWEDDRDGTRVAGARSATWDTALSVQALAAIEEHAEHHNSLALAETFLASQQIVESPRGHENHHRIDPRGGYAVSFRSQAWPLSDATAEAMIARLSVAGDGPRDADVLAAAAFVLRAQAKDGGFGSYEPRRKGPSLEWLSPAEIFGEHMTERSYVECTASCIGLLSIIKEKRPHLLRKAALADLLQQLERAALWLRKSQRPEGCWQGAWGVHYVYGTLFGIRGLLAAGVPATDPAIKKATAWLRAHQKPDGSWGERHAPHTTSYVETEEGQVVQTAWALYALVLASEPDFDCLDRAARFLARTQLGSGEWPRQEPHGVFFHTALLDYSLYKSYFPLLALAVFEKRRAERDLLIQEAKRGTVAAE